MTSRRPILAWTAACALIVLVSGLVYLRSMGGELVWDDYWLVGGEGIGGGRSLARCFTQPFLHHYFRPLVSVSFFFQRRLFGWDPNGYRLVNILLHLATTGGLMCLLLEMIGSRRAALAGGVLFAVQPAQVGAVAWIGGHTDALAAFWTVLLAWALLRAAREPGNGRWGWILSALLAYNVALYTKEQFLFLLPLVPLAFACFPPREGRNPRGMGWWVALPFAASAAVFFTLGWSLGMPRAGGVILPVPELLAQAGRTVTYYTLLLLAPTPRWMHTLSLSVLEHAGWWPVVLGYAVLAAVAWLFVRWRRAAPAAAWLLALIVLSLVPVLNFLPAPFILAAPYRAGVAGLGVAALLGWALGRGRTAEPQRRRGGMEDFEGDDGRPTTDDGGLVPQPSTLNPQPSSVTPSRLFLAVMLLISVWWGGLTAWGAQQWRSEAHIFGNFVRYDPESLVARYVLAGHYFARGKDEEGAEQIEKLFSLLFRSSAWQSAETAVEAIRQDPRILDRARQNQGSRDDPRWWVAMLYVTLGRAYYRLGAPGWSLQAFQAGQAMHPESVDVRRGLGQLAYESRQYQEAIGHMRYVLASEPQNAQAYAYLGRSYAGLGRWEEARDAFKAWERLEPSSPEARASLRMAQEILKEPSTR